MKFIWQEVAKGTEKIHNEETKVTETNEEESFFRSKRTYLLRSSSLLRSFVVNLLRSL